LDYSHTGLKLHWDRDDAICELCAGKHVLHVGATDAPYTREKFEDGLLLHTKLSRHAASVQGIDIDEDAIDFLRQHGVSNISYFDMNNIASIAFEPDIIVFGEIIEHLLNFDAAFDNLRAAMSDHTELIITTPNLFYLRQFLRLALMNKEEVHPEHTVGFTLGLLSQMLRENALEIDRAMYTFLPRKHLIWKNHIIRTMCRARPSLAETIVAVCRRR
jgi:2-polyprenyl-3-methyl-5-hydroxy-6-metoxy-1,4-benzoquinol methylase